MSATQKIIHLGTSIAFVFLIGGLFFVQYSFVHAAMDGDSPFYNSETQTTDTGAGGGTGGNTNSTGGNSNSTGGNINSGPPGTLTNPLKSDSIEAFLFKIIDVLLVFALPLIILYIMYAGYLFVTAAGNTEQLSTAKSALLWSVVGGVIVLGARVILSVIEGTVRAF